eukprot:Seg11329.1 transcript_id=Seg11329.1/GoldUCD/mRNA.D3Y31 product="hypothetical protein" protein_id=Seg11329.1/GoldUCD/D3Y31
MVSLRGNISMKAYFIFTGETVHFENLMHFSTPVAKRRKAFNLSTAESVSSIENSLIDVAGNSSDISTLVLNPISSTATEHQDTSFTARCHSANYEFGMLPGIPFEKPPIESCNDCTSDLPSDTDSSTDSSCDDVSTSSSSYGSDSVSDEVSDYSSSEYSECSLL